MTGRRLTLPALLLALACGAGAADTIRVMTFNLRYDNPDDGSNRWNNADQDPERREFAVTVITNLMPDLIGFQEPQDTHLTYLSNSLAPLYALTWARPSGGSDERAALAYNTNRLELLDRGVFSLGPSPGGGYWNNTPGTNFQPTIYFPDMGLSFPRLALWGRFRWRATDQELLFCTTHYDFNNTPQVKSATLMVNDALARNNLMPSSPMAVVVGDFNSTHNNDDWRLFTGGYTNDGVTGDFTDSWAETHGAWTDSGTIHGFTGGTISEAFRIDWILHRGGLTATQAVIVTDSVISTNTAAGGSHRLYASDHYPVYADLVIADPLPDHDRDGLPDGMELVSSNSLPADPDTDNDLLVDGQEDLDGDGLVEGGESHPNEPAAAQNPTDIRHYQMDGLHDQRAVLLTSDGMQLRFRFDGRYLYVSTADAGEGSDHFVFITRNPDDAVPAPWAKTGMVARCDAFLADENDSDFAAWFDAAGAQITNLFDARSAAYYQNGGALEGVIDLSQIYGAGFTAAFHVATGPYATTNGGHLWPSAQAPAGNGDGHILGTGEYIRIDPGDMDGDAVSDLADPDADGDGLPDAWEVAHGLDPASGAGRDGARGDPDADGSPNIDECRACTAPDDPASVLQILTAAREPDALRLTWPAVHAKVYTVWRTTAEGLKQGAGWACCHTNTSNTGFPIRTNTLTIAGGGEPSGFHRIHVNE